MNFFFCLTNFLIGSCLASHAAVVSDRFEQGDFIFDRSRCASCYSQLSLLDELPVISYFWLRGKCRYCGSDIPVKLPFIEVIGGFAFLNVDFSTSDGILTAIFIFSILLVAISDYDHLQFSLVMLAPAILLALSRINKIFSFQLVDYFELVSILIILIYYVCRNKLGGGDLIVYLVLVLYYSPHFANSVFLLGSISFIIHFMLERKTRSVQETIPFVPYIFLGLTVQLLC